MQRGKSSSTGPAGKFTGPTHQGQGSPTRVESQATNQAGHAAAEKNLASLSKNRSPQAPQAVAGRKEYWNRWTKDNQARLQKFQAARDPQWKQIANWRQGKNVAQAFHSDSWRAYRDNVINTQEEKGDAFMFLQLSVNKAGTISGAYANVLSGEKEPVVGQIDKANQRAAFRIGNTQGSGNTSEQTVIEAGAYNLTQDVASCAVRFESGKAQTWLMVRLPAPTIPNAPTPIGEQPSSAENHS